MLWNFLNYPSEPFAPIIHEFPELSQYIGEKKI